MGPKPNPKSKNQAGCRKKIAKKPASSRSGKSGKSGWPKWNQEVKDKAAKAKKQEEGSPEEEAQDKAAKAKKQEEDSPEEDSPEEASPSSCHVDVEATDDVDACSRTVSTQTPDSPCAASGR